MFIANDATGPWKLRWERHAEPGKVGWLLKIRVYQYSSVV